MMESGKACSYYAKYAKFFNLLCSHGGGEPHSHCNTPNRLNYHRDEDIMHIFVSLNVILVETKLC